MGSGGKFLSARLQLFGSETSLVAWDAGEVEACSNENCLLGRFESRTAAVCNMQRARWRGEEEEEQRVMISLLFVLEMTSLGA